MTNSSRVTTAPTAANTSRLETTGAVAEVPPVFSGDTWGGTWGTTWSRTWYNATELVPAVTASPSISTTGRIAGAITENSTKRVQI